MGMGMCMGMGMGMGTEVSKLQTTGYMVAVSAVGLAK